MSNHYLLVMMLISSFPFLGKTQISIDTQPDIIENRKKFDSLILGNCFVCQSVQDDSSFIQLNFDRKKLHFQKISKFVNYSAFNKFRVKFELSNSFTIIQTRRKKAIGCIYGLFSDSAQVEFYIIANDIGVRNDLYEKPFEEYGYKCVLK